MSLTSSDKAWIAILGGVVGFNLWCEDGFTLSERMDDYLAAHPVLGRVLIGIVAIHLANGVTPRYDIVHVSFVGARCGKTWCVKRVALKRIRR